MATDVWPIVLGIHYHKTREYAWYEGKQADGCYCGRGWFWAVGIYSLCVVWNHMLSLSRSRSAWIYIVIRCVAIFILLIVNICLFSGFFFFNMLRYWILVCNHLSLLSEISLEWRAGTLHSLVLLDLTLINK